MDFILLLVGLVLIIKCADVLIDSTAKIARKYGVPSFVIGITVVAFGTSMPEFVVGLLSAINKTNQLSLGNIVGSSYANTALIIGIAATILPLVVKSSAVKREIPMLIFVQGAFAFMVLIDGKLSRLDGALLLLGFVGFIVYIILVSKKTINTPLIDDEAMSPNDDTSAGKMEDEESKKESNPVKLWIFSALSLAGLFVGGQLAVDNSANIAARFGMSETLIGITVVAIATTLPELIASLMAIRKNEPDIVLGNCVGSNLFNTLLVLGASSAIHPIITQGNLTLDMLLMILLTVLVFVVSFCTKRVPRWFGITLMLSYFAYICVKVVTALVY